MDDGQEQIIGECLKAADSGRFFPDWEFHTLFGLERDEVAKVASAWPNVDLSDERVCLAINNSFGNLLNYPIDHPKEWPDYLSVSREELETNFDRWRNSPAV